MIRKLWNKTGVFLVLFVSAIFVLLQSPLAPGANGVPGVDSSVFLYCASQILEGKLIYKEIFDHKGPFMYVIDVVGITISPRGSYLGVWLLELLSLIGSSVFMYKTLRFIYNRLISILATVSGQLFIVPLLIGGNLTEEWAILPISIALYIFCRYFFKKQYLTVIEIFILSLTFSLTFLLKSNMTIVWIVFGSVIFFSLSLDKKFKELCKYALYTINGLVISFLPFFVYGYTHGNLKDAIFCFFEYNSKYFVSWNYSILVYTLKSLLGFSFLSIIFSIYLSYLAIQLLFDGFSGKDEKYKVQFTLGIFFSFVLSALACSLGGRHEHYFMMFAPLVIFAFAFGFDLIITKVPSLKRFPFLVLVIISLNAQNIHRQIKTTKLNFDQGVVSGLATPSKKVIDRITNLIKIETYGDDEILVKGNMCSVYLLSGKNCSSKYPYRTVFNKKMEDEYIELIIKRKPKLILSGEVVNDWYLNDSIDVVLDEKYTLKNNEIDGLNLWVLKESE